MTNAQLLTTLIVAVFANITTITVAILTLRNKANRDAVSDLTARVTECEKQREDQAKTIESLRSENLMLMSSYVHLNQRRNESHNEE